MNEYAERIKQQRHEKDDFFSSHPRSPIDGEFDGLNYFRPDEEYRLKVELHEHDDKEKRVIGTTTGGKREYIRWGEFRFEIDGTEHTLQAYKSEPEEDRLWVPFRDETSGDQTYGTGRYMDIEKTEDGYVLDFNTAYNPYCAYNEDYECPLVPSENTLEVPIKAGEKKYN